jgi:3-dehydroquinate synthetase
MKTINFEQVITKLDEYKYIIIDKNIYELYSELRPPLTHKVVYTFIATERNKSLKAYEEALEFFISNNISRDDELLVIGGGITSDLGGFVAATLLRGINWSVMPTTLLAQIDASIGGKVGVNSSYGKNLIGNFHLPQAVYLCEKFLTTLDKADYESGLGELIKYAFLSDEVYKLIMDKKVTNDLIKCCAEYKQSIVDHDLREGHARKVLNLGHTLGHAIERAKDIPHGVAVYWGLKLILEMYATKEINNYFNDLSSRLGLSFELGLIDWNTFEKHLLKDKKIVASGKIDLILVEEIGKVQISSKRVTEFIFDIKEKLHEYFSF